MNIETNKTQGILLDHNAVDLKKHMESVKKHMESVNNKKAPTTKDIEIPEKSLENQLLEKAFDSGSYKKANQKLSFKEKKALQKFVRGNNAKEVDGIIGIKTWEKIQEKNKELGSERISEAVQKKLEYKSVLTETRQRLTENELNIFKFAIKGNKTDNMKKNVGEVKQIGENTKPNEGNSVHNPESENSGIEKNLGNDRKIADRLYKEFGLEDFQIAGILGSLMKESSLNPSAKSESGCFGIAQWVGVRKTALYKFAKERNVSPTDFDMQVDFLIKEMKKNRIGALNGVKKSTTIEEATNVFTKKFEAPKYEGPNYPKRIKMAKKVYEKLYGST